MRDYREIPLWRDISLETWQDWKWQVRNRLRSLEELRQVISLTSAEETSIVHSIDSGFPVAITPYYAMLMDPEDPACPIRRQGIPSSGESVIGRYEFQDPLNEDVDSPVPFLTHRYPDRVLFIVTEMCSLYCRHCTRRRLVGSREGGIPKGAIDAALDYIAHTPAVRDVLISGGDPLSLVDDRIEYILAGLRRIPHVEVIRFGTRTLVTNPFRITEGFCEMVRRYHPIWLNTHFNHPREVTPEAVAACDRLSSAGVPLGNQTVLLRGVNDCPYIQKELVQLLVKARVRPYYLYQCDLAEGLEHFRTPVSKGIEIIEHLRGHVSGYAVPTYVIDAPGGGGKIPIGPNYVLSQSPDKIVLRNYEGRVVAYPESNYRDTHDAENCAYCRKGRGAEEGVAALLHGDRHSLDMSHNAREQWRASHIGAHRPAGYNRTRPDLAGTGNGGSSVCDRDYGSAASSGNGLTQGDVARCNGCRKE